MSANPPSWTHVEWLYLYVLSWDSRHPPKTYSVWSSQDSRTSVLEPSSVDGLLAHRHDMVRS